MRKHAVRYAIRLAASAAACLALFSCAVSLSRLLPAAEQAEGAFLAASDAASASIQNGGIVFIPDANVDRGDQYRISVKNLSSASLDLNSGLGLEGPDSGKFSAVFLESATLAPGQSAQIGVTCKGSSFKDSTRPSCGLRIHESQGLMPDFVLYLDASPSALGFVTHLAGAEDDCSGSQDGQGRNARFNYIGGIASDGSSVFVTDQNNHAIRKIDIATGTVTTFAGLALSSGSADGIGPEARFRYPTALACDGENLYIYDSNNFTIRKMDIATQSVSTLAGTAGQGGFQDGVGPAARFGSLNGLCYDPVGGYLYSMEWNAIRRIARDSGAVTTIAGSYSDDGTVDGVGPAARFIGTTGIACVGQHIYVSQSNYVIRRVNLSSRQVETVAGTEGQSGTADGIGAAARFYYPSGLAENGGNLYLMDSSRLRRLDPGTLAVTTISGDSYQHLDGPLDRARYMSGYRLCSAGNSLFLDESLCVRRIDLEHGMVTSLAGNGPRMSYEDGVGAAARFFQPESMVMAGGLIYVCDTGNHVIRTVNPATGAVSTFAGDPAVRGGADGVGLLAQFSNPVGLATNGVVLFVADPGNSTVRSVDLTTREVRTLAGLAGSPGYADGNAASARFSGPYALAYGNGFLYVADTGNRVLRSIDLSSMEVGTVAGLAGSGGILDGIGSAARFLSVRSMAYLDGSIYMGDGDGFSFSYSYLRKVNLSTAEVRTIMTPHRHYSNYFGLYGRKGTLFFSEWTNDFRLQGSSLLALDTATETVETISGYPFATGEVDGDMGRARFDYLYGITGDAVNLYVSDVQDSNIRKIGRAR